MPDPVKIVITADASGAITGLKLAGDSVEGLGKSTESAGSAMDAFGKTVQTAFFAVNVGEKALGWADSFITLGESVKRSNAEFDILTNNQSAQWMDKLKTATHGAVDDMVLAHSATLMLASGLVTTSDQAARLTQIANDLGISIQDLPQMLEQAGATGRVNAFAQYGINIKAMKEEIKGGTSALQAFEDVAGPLADKLDPIVGQTDQWAKMKTTIGDIADEFAQWAAGGLNKALDSATGLGKQLAIIASYKGLFTGGDSNIGGIVGNYIAQNGLSAPGGGSVAGVEGGLFRNGENVSVGQGAGVGAGNVWGTSGTAGVMSKGPATGHEAYGAIASGDMSAVSGQYGVAVNLITTSAHAHAQALDHLNEADNKAAAAMDHMAEAAVKIPQSFAEAFKIGSGSHGFSGVGSELGGGLAGDFGAEQKNLERMFGPNSKQAIEYAKQSKQAMDDYRIATGQASAASISAETSIAAINKGIASGAISAQEGTREMLAYAKAIESGKTSIADLAHLQLQVNTGGILGQVTGRQSHLAEGTDGGATTVSNDPTKSAADAAKADIATITSASSDMADGVAKNAAKGGGALQAAFADARKTAVADLQAIAAQFSGLSGSISITVSATSRAGGP